MVKKAIKENDWEHVRNIIDPKDAIINYGHGNIEIRDNVFYWKGTEMHNGISTRIIEMLQDGFTVEPMVEFMHNVMSNPSKRSVDLLYNFLDKCDLPITPDGHFLAYKKVRKDYKDCHSGTIDNSVGQVAKMDRNMVDDDPNSTCSAGLHFCSISYLGSFPGDRIMILKINPRDVVSIPSDYNDAKGRCCRYEVVGELDVPPEQAFKTSVDTKYAPVEEGIKLSDGWINWTGGTRPTNGHVDIRLGNGEEVFDVPSGYYSWSSSWSLHERVIAYRLVETKDESYEGYGDDDDWDDWN